MQQQERLAEHKVLDRQAVGLRVLGLQLRLRDLDVPVAEVIPEKPVEGLGRRAELEGREARSTSRVDGEEPVEDRVVVGVELRRIDPRQDRRRRGVVAGRPAHLAEAAGVPELVAEVLAALDPVLLEADVLALRRDRDDAEAQAVGAVVVDQVEGIRANCRATSTSCGPGVADDAGEVDVPERDPPLERLARAA